MSMPSELFSFSIASCPSRRERRAALALEDAGDREDVADVVVHDQTFLPASTEFRIEAPELFADVLGKVRRRR
jgi:hypothetical protein